MARAAHITEEDEGVLLRRYLRNLARDGSSMATAPSPGHDVRTCPACGEWSTFSLDAEGMWYRCSHCGHYA